MELGRWGVGEDLKGVGGGKTILRICHMEKSIFNFFKKKAITGTLP